MMKKIIVLTACLLMVGAGVPFASDWLHFIDTEKGEKCSIDLDSIRRVSSGVMMVKRKVEPRNSRDVSAFVSHLEIDCSNSRLRVMKEITHYKNGNAGTTAGDAEFSNVSDEDFEESLMELVCSLKKRTR